MTLHHFKKEFTKKYFRFCKHYVMNQEERSIDINLVGHDHSRTKGVVMGRGQRPILVGN
jgi:hypothetical protein